MYAWSRGKKLKFSEKAATLSSQLAAAAACCQVGLAPAIISDR